MTELVEVIIEEIVVKLKYALREEQQYQEDIGQQVGKEFNFFMLLKKRRKREGNGLYHYHRLLLDKEVVDGKVKQDLFTRVKELQGVILNKLFTLNEKQKKKKTKNTRKWLNYCGNGKVKLLPDLRVDLINCKNKVTSLKLNCPSRKQLI